mgnify:CR=1 FL=1
MNKSDYIKKFNNLVTSLLSQLSPIIGSKHYRNYNLFIKVNSMIGLDHFLEYMYPLKNKIIKKDESYFINCELPDELKKDKIILDEILRLKDIYYQVDNKSKESLWIYLQSMLGIAEEYYILTNNLN